jgi:hypothetical protein
MPSRGHLGSSVAPMAVGCVLALACGSSHGPSGDVSGDDGGVTDSGTGNADTSIGGGSDAPVGTTDAVADGKASDGSGNGGDGGPAGCKRGIATNTPPSTAIAPSATVPGVSWWYDWSNQGTGGASAVEFVPMIWGGKDLNGPVPAGSSYLLGFNEPNFTSGADLTPTQAAADWPQVEALAKPLGIPLVSPAVNFCGSSTDTTGCSDPSVTDPYTWLEDFFAACTGCEIDYVAVHWYNCDLPSLQGYIDGSASLEGFVQFGKPIWLTEFACPGSNTVAEQQTYMEAAVPYLEGNPHVYRYSWFSASNIASALLMNPDGSLTALGTTYVGLPEACR